MRIPLLAGRMLDARDGKDSRVTLANQALAKKYFPNADPVGKRLKFGRPTDDDPWMTIVGIVADDKQDAMDKPARPEVFVSMTQNPQNPMTFVVRSTRDTESTVAAVRDQVHAVDKDLVLTDVAALTDVVQAAMANERFRTTLLSAFAGVALFLAALGVYGVLAYFVTQRSRELGIRLALGARRGSLFTLVLRQGLRPVAIGAAVGVIAAAGVTRAMQSLLFEVTPIDPATYGVALTMLVAIAITACALPAARATRVDPLIALRDE